NFSESLILCPTSAAAQTCIRRDLAGARSFLVIADGLLRQLRRRHFQFAKECPEYQTRYYLLSCAVEEFSQKQKRERAVAQWSVALMTTDHRRQLTTDYRQLTTDNYGFSLLP